jgi:hypothetical protein
MEVFVTAKQLGGIQLLADNDWNSDFILKYGVFHGFILLGPDGTIVNSDAQDRLIKTSRKT